MSRLRIILAFILIVLLISFPAISVLYTDYLWFSDLGYTQALLLRFFYQAVLFLLGLIISSIVIFANILPTLKEIERVYAIPISRAERMLYYMRQALKRYYRLFALIIGAAISLFFAFILSKDWELAALFYNRASSGIKVPVFNTDASFFLFSLPFLDKVAGWLLFLFLVALLLVLASYFFRSLTYSWNAFVQLFYWYRTHIFILLSALSAVGAFRIYIQSFERAYSSFGVVFGPTYVDASYLINFYKVFALILVLLAVFFLLTSFRYLRVRVSIIAGITAFAVYVLGAGAVPFLIQTYVVSPNELRKEMSYIKNHIAMTRLGYDLNRFSLKELSTKRGFTSSDISLENPAIKNVRLWDNEPLIETFNQLQAIRTYYVFKDIDIDRYLIDGKKTQVALSVRELDTQKLADRAKTWINLHLKYTHGYGVVASYVSTATGEGLPVFIVKNVPPETAFPDLKLKYPQIYFGEKTDSYVIVKTREAEFEYPSGSKNVYGRFKGNTGIKLDSYLKKLAFSLRFGSFKILLSSDITNESRMLFIRNVLDRVKKITPYIAYDNDPYPVIARGRVYWIVDGYTYSSWLPYSDPYSGNINYIRNSVKAVVDAYTGEVNFYIFDEEDPIIKTYAKIFKNVFKDRSELPDYLKAHIRYPVDLFKIQVEMLANYHMTDPQVFYNKEDRWAPAEEIYDRERVRVEPYYVLIPFDPAEMEGEPEFILMQPLTPYGKNNLNAWMFISSDGDNYGKGAVYQFPKGELVFGPLQIESRIDQDPDISKELTLWGQAGSQVIRGNLLVLPLRTGVIYIEPLYLRSEQGSIPELKRVIAATEDKVVMSDSLKKSLFLLTGKPSLEEKPVPQAVNFTEIQKIIDEMDKALKSGDLKLFADYYVRLKETLKKTEETTTVKTP